MHIVVESLCYPSKTNIICQIYFNKPKSKTKPDKKPYFFPSEGFPRWYRSKGDVRKEARF